MRKLLKGLNKRAMVAVVIMGGVMLAGCNSKGEKLTSNEIEVGSVIGTEKTMESETSRNLETKIENDSQLPQENGDVQENEDAQENSEIVSEDQVGEAFIESITETDTESMVEPDSQETSEFVTEPVMEVGSEPYREVEAPDYQVGDYYVYSTGDLSDLDSLYFDSLLALCPDGDLSVLFPTESDLPPYSQEEAISGLVAGLKSKGMLYYPDVYPNSIAGPSGGMGWAEVAVKPGTMDAVIADLLEFYEYGGYTYFYIDYSRTIGKDVIVRAYYG